MNAAYPYIGAVCFALALAYVGPRLDESTAVHEDAISAQQAAQQRARFERAAQAMCGENAGWRELEGGAVQCHLKNGKRAGVVRVAL